jgi:cytochrome c5
MLSGSKNKYTYKLRDIAVSAATLALVTAFALPFLSGSSSKCPVLQERQPATTAAAMAVPAFARKYNVDCTYCHTAWPQLNRTGLIFRYLGYRMPYEVPPQPGMNGAAAPATSQKPKTGQAGKGPIAQQPPQQAGEPATTNIGAPAIPEAIEKGRKVANSMQCLTCHVGGGNIVNPSKPIKGQGFHNKYPEDAQIASIIRHGVAGTAMPAYSNERLSDDQLQDLIVYIRSLTPRN